MWKDFDRPSFDFQQNRFKPKIKAIVKHGNRMHSEVMREGGKRRRKIDKTVEVVKRYLEIFEKSECHYGRTI